MHLQKPDAWDWLCGNLAAADAMQIENVRSRILDQVSGF